MTNLERALSLTREIIRTMPSPPDAQNLRIMTRLRGGNRELKQNGAVSIAISGDSVSHGCFAPPRQRDYNAVYHNRLRLMLGQKFPDPPVNILNCAVGGMDASYGLAHFDGFILPHKPDLTILCYGLNDVNGSLSDYSDNIRGLMRRCHENGLECVFLTPNMLNTYVSPDTEVHLVDYAKKTAEMQNGGKMDAFMEEARRVSKEEKVPLCDAYAVWKKLAEEGCDTTDLLINRINHPDYPMHSLFAELLYAHLVGEPFTFAESEATDGMIAFS